MSRIRTKTIRDMEAQEEIGFEEQTEKSPAEVETNGPETANGVIVNAFVVNARKEPSFESEVVETMVRGEKVTILGKKGRFYKVRTERHDVAYIVSEFVEEE